MIPWLIQAYATLITYMHHVYTQYATCLVYIFCSEVLVEVSWLTWSRPSFLFSETFKIIERQQSCAHRLFSCCCDWSQEDQQHVVLHLSLGHCPPRQCCATTADTATNLYLMGQHPASSLGRTWSRHLKHTAQCHAAQWGLATAGANDRTTLTTVNQVNM